MQIVWPHLPPPPHNNPNPIHHTVQNVLKSSFPCCVCGVAYAKLILRACFQVIDIKDRLRESKRFWSALPDSICAEDTVTDPDEEQCWNSHTKGRQDGHLHTHIPLGRVADCCVSMTPSMVIVLAILGHRQIQNTLLAQCTRLVMIPN